MSSSEAAYSAEIIKELNRRGCLAWKLSERFSRGVPDIYFAGGNWIESKFAPVEPRRGVNALNYLSMAQRIRAGRLMAAGDNVLIAINWVITVSLQFSTIIPYPVLLEDSYVDMELIERVHYKPIHKNHEVERFYDPDQHRNINWTRLNRDYNCNLQRLCAQWTKKFRDEPELLAWPSEDPGPASPRPAKRGRPPRLRPQHEDC